MLLNENIKDLPEEGVSVKKRILDFQAKNPSATLIRLDQDLMNMPLPTKVIEKMKAAVDEVAEPFGVRLSSPWSGYRSLKQAVVEHFSALGVAVSEEEVFITSGSESAYACISQLFAADNTVLLPDPCEGSLVRLQQAAGRSISYSRATPANHFAPAPGQDPVDLIYLASPNPVTGACMTREELKAWVDWANETESVILYDSSLSEYLAGSEYPRSIYEIEGATHCAIELFSFEKGYGVRELKIAYVVIPSVLTRNTTRLQQLWRARQPATATPPSFIMQVAATELFSQESRAETEKILYRIQKVAKVLSQGLTDAGIPHVGQNTGPFLWAQCPDGLNSWQCFDRLLEEAGLVVTPGSLFGYGGERFFRLTAFGMPEEAKTAAEEMVRIFAAPKQEDPAEEDVAKHLLGE